MTLGLKDADWVKNAFMIPTYAVDEIERKSRILSTAAFKFTDTTLGGNMCINPAPQFTRYADIKMQGRYARNVNPLEAGSKGMGRYYSEALDDNKQVIHMRFGVPAFNSMTQFFTSFYDPGAGYLANTGRTSQVFFNIGRLAGFVVSIAAMPIILIGSWANNMINYMLNKPTSKYYYLKPSMPLYWNAVNMICNSIAANQGIVPRMHIPGTVRMDTEDQLTQTELTQFYNLNRDIYKPGGGIDIYAVANKAQRLADLNRQHLSKALGVDGGLFNNDGANQLLRQNLQQFVNTTLNDPGTGDVISDNTATTDSISNKISAALGFGETLQSQKNTLTGIDAYIQTYVDSQFGVIKQGSEGDKPEDSSTWAMLEKSADLFKAEARDGSAFVSFRVDYTGPASESFSNNARESDLAQKLNSTSSGNRETRFNLADGNLGDNPIMGAIGEIGKVINAAAAGFTMQLGLGGLMALSGRGLIDIPKHWDSSSVNLPRMDYTIELRSPYGNKMSMFQNLYVPLAMILAGCMPLSTGKQSYTSPFLVEIHSKGRVSCRLGLIESVSVTRGTGNLGWTDDDQPLGIDLSFSVLDLSSIMHMPINAGMNIGATIAAGVGTAASTLTATIATAAGTADPQGYGDAAFAATQLATASMFDEDNAFTDYMAVLGSLGLEDMVYGSNKLKLRATQRMLEFNSWRSVSHFANWFNGTMPGRMISAIAQQGSRDNQ